MESDNISVEKFISDYTRKYIDELSLRVKKEKIRLPAVTIAMEPGSGGFLIAERVAKRLDFDFYYRDLLLPMAHTGDVNPATLNAMEKMRLSGFHDLVSSLLNRDYLHTDQYMSLLEDTVVALGAIGHSVIVGRGANFILSPEKRFAVRVIAPLEVRIKNVAFAHGVSLKDAEKRIKNRAAKRKGFIKQNFQKDVDNPLHYDLVINSGRLDVDSAADSIVGTILGSQINRAFDKSESYILRKSK
jgi:cytidylate kinase